MSQLQMRRDRVRGLESHRVIDRVRLALLNVRHRGLREPRLESHDRLRFGGGSRRGVAEEHQHARDVSDIGGACRLECGLVLQIVIAIRQPEAALARHRDHPRAVLEILHLTQGQRRLDADRQKMCQGLRQLVARGDGGYARKLRRERRRAGRIDRSLIHAARVEIGDLALRRAGSPVLPRERLDQVTDENLVLLFEQRVDAPVGAVRGDRMRLDPSAVRELKKVLGGSNRAVEPVEIQAVGLGVALRDLAERCPGRGTE